MEPDPSTWEVDPSAKVTGELCGEEEMEENKLELPVIWSVAPESITHLDDDERRQEVGLPESAIAVTEEDECFKESWY